MSGDRGAPGPGPRTHPRTRPATSSGTTPGSLAVAVLLLGASALAGCATLDGQPACPDPALKEQAWEGSLAYFADLAGKRIAFTQRGLTGGQAVDRTVVLDPADQQMSVRARAPAAEDARWDGAWYSLDNATFAGHGRDHRPGGAMAPVYTFLVAALKGLAPAPGDRLAADDLDAACATGDDGTPTIVYTWQGDGGDAERTIVVERDAPHRPLRLAKVDPAAGDDYRMTLDHGPQDVAVDRTLARLPGTVWYVATDVATNDRGGPRVEGRLVDGSEWLSLAEVGVRLVDPDGNETLALPVDGSDAPDADGATGSSRTLDLPDGSRFTWDDADGNGYTSPGDTFLLDLDADQDLLLWDRWADAPLDARLVG